MSERLAALQSWLGSEAGLGASDLEIASGDASFRRYYRVRKGDETWIAVDARPDREDSRPFVKVAGLLGDMGLNAPQVLASDLDRGFMLLSDLGRQLYLGALSDETVDRLYGDALVALVTLQARGPKQRELPPYDRRLLLAEMALFREWLLGAHLGLSLSGADHRLLDDVFGLLADSALEQPRVMVHRDYHSRNLMVTGSNNPGILDFQDAVIGPVTYDLVSLLRDCYIAWPRQRVEEWALGYREMARKAGILTGDQDNETRWLRWFDWMGVQRHLKAAGIFARLNHRDGKSGYLGDIPRTLGYVAAVSLRYQELHPLADFLERNLESRWYAEDAQLV